MKDRTIAPAEQPLNIPLRYPSKAYFYRRKNELNKHGKLEGHFVLKMC